MSTLSSVMPRPISAGRLVQEALDDFKSRADARREIIWNIGRLLLIVTFIGIYFRDPGEANDLAAVIAVSAAGAAVSGISTFLVLRNRVFAAFLVSTTNDLLGLFLGWSALMIFGPVGTAESEGWLSLFPVLISLPYRLGSVAGVVAGVSVIVWLGILHYTLVPEGNAVLERLPVRGATLLVTLLIAGTFNYVLARRTKAMLEQSNEIEFLNGQNQAKSEFIVTVSHELRTPITVVLALIRRIVRNQQHNLSDQQIEHLKVVMRNADHLSELISDLLAVTQIEREGVKYRRSAVSLNRFLRDSVAGLRTVSSARDQSIKLNLPPIDSIINSDEIRLTQVINNLLANSSRYSPRGAEISVDVSVGAENVQIAVTNPAGELTQSDTERMFEMFFRADTRETRETSGTGLGLHICRRIVEGLGGEICASISNGLLTVSFTVPR